MALASSDHYPCRMISPSVVLDHRLDGADLAWVRDHLRRCEDCRQRVEVLREQLLLDGRLVTELGAIPAVAGLMPSMRRRASAHREHQAHSRRYAMVGLMVALVAGFFVSSDPRLGADAVKQAPTSSVLLDTGSVDAPRPSTPPSPSATPQPTAPPATSQGRAVPAVVVRSSQPAPAHPPASTPAPVADAPPAVILTVTPLSGLAPLTVTADASRSTDTDASRIASYAFDFGDGSSTTRSTRSAATHTYCQPGIYRLTALVADTSGQQSTAFLYVDIIQPVNPVSC